MSFAAGLSGEYAPPAIFVLHERHTQMPFELLFRDFFMQLGHRCFARDMLSTVATFMRVLVPYLALNLPAVPTFFVILSPFDCVVLRDAIFL